MKNWKQILPYGIAIITFILFAMLYCTPIFQGKVLHAGDVVNWQGAAHEANEHYNKTGESTWWTNSMFGGMPTYQITGKMPTTSLIQSVQLIARAGFKGTTLPIGILFAFFFGFFLMLRCFGINPWLSIIGAFAIGLSTYFLLIIPAGHITKASAIGFLAPVIGGVYAIYRRKYWLGGSLVLIYGFISLTMHPQMTYYIFMLIGVMIITEIYIHVHNQEWINLGVSTLILVVALLLVLGTKMAWFQMNNEYLKETMRGGHSELTNSEQPTKNTDGLDIDYATAWSYGKLETLNLMIPNLMGGASGYNVGEKSVLYNELVKARVPKGSAKQFCQQAPTYWGEKAFTSGPVYVGAIICFLFILGLIIVHGPYKWALLIATVFSVLLAWGHNFMSFTELFYNYFPMYNKFRAVESILVVAEITIPLIGFLGLQHICKTKADHKKYQTPILIAGGITAGICLFFAIFGDTILNFTSSYDNQWKGQVGNDIYKMIISQRISMLKMDSWRSFIFIVLATSLAYAYVSTKKLKAGYFYGLMAILILVDMVPINRRFFNSNSFETKKNTDRLFTMQSWEEQILQDRSLDFRVLNLTTNTFNDARTSYRLKSIGGYSAAKLRRYQDLIDAHIAKNNFQVLNMLNTKYFITRNGVQLNPEAFGNAWFVDEVQFVDTPDQESQALWTLDLRHKAVADKTFKEVLSTDNAEGKASILMTTYAPNKLEYIANTPTDRVVVFSEIYYPYDWHLYIDGIETTLGRANYALRAAVIPAGEHNIMMEFTPSSLKTDKWCLILSIFILLIAALGLTYPLYKNILPKK